MAYEIQGDLWWLLTSNLLVDQPLMYSLHSHMHIPQGRSVHWRDESHADGPNSAISGGGRQGGGGCWMQQNDPVT